MSIGDAVQKSETWRSTELTKECYDYFKLYSGKRVLSRFGWPGLLGGGDPNKVKDMAFCFLEIEDKDVIPHKKYSVEQMKEMMWIVNLQNP